MSNNIENNTENTKRRHKMTEKTKWIITGVLCLLAVLTVIIVAKDGCFDFKPGSVQANNNTPVESEAPDKQKSAHTGTGKHTVLVTAGNGGTTDPNGSVSVEDWGSVTVNFTPSEGYEILNVSIDGSDKGAVESYTLSNITEDHSIIATFAKKPEPTPSPTPSAAQPAE